MTWRSRPRVAAAFAATAVIVIGGGVWWLRSASQPSGWPAWLARTSATAAPIRPLRIVPGGTRIKVEVLNATDRRGLARLATFALRDAGFDVVSFGNTSERRDTTQVLDRSGHAEWAAWAAQVMQPADVAARPDSGRLVDLTVVVGRIWRPPAEPLRP